MDESDTGSTRRYYPRPGTGNGIIIGNSTCTQRSASVEDSSIAINNDRFGGSVHPQCSGSVENCLATFSAIAASNICALPSTCTDLRRSVGVNETADGQQVGASILDAD